MSVQKRRCATCKFFNDAQMSGNGWCTHPKRQVSTDVRILVRKGELACRNNWGEDLWLNLDSDATVSEPTAASPVEYVTSNESVDDHVTFVASQNEDAASRDDIVVQHTSMLSEEARASLRPRPMVPPEIDNELNTPAHDDQLERVQVIARGNRDAILRARKRHSSRRSGIQQPAAEDTVPNVREQSASATEDSTGEPTSCDVPVEDIRRPKDSYVSQTGQDRFSSIPEIRPDVELPRLRQFLQPNGSRQGNNGPGRMVPVSTTSTSYDYVLERAQAIKAASQTSRSRRVQQERSRRTNQLIAVRQAIESSSPCGSNAAPAPTADLDADVSIDLPVTDLRDAFGFSPITRIAAAAPEANATTESGKSSFADAIGLDHASTHEPGANTSVDSYHRAPRRHWWNRRQRGQDCFVDDVQYQMETTEEDGWKDDTSGDEGWSATAAASADVEDQILSVNDRSKPGENHLDADEDYVFPDDNALEGEDLSSYEVLDQTLGDDAFDYQPDDDEVLDSNFTGVDESSLRSDSSYEHSYEEDDLLVPGAVASASQGTAEAIQPIVQVPGRVANGTRTPDSRYDLADESGMDAFRAALFGERHSQQSHLGVPLDQRHAEPLRWRPREAASSGSGQQLVEPEYDAEPQWQHVGTEEPVARPVTPRRPALHRPSAPPREEPGSVAAQRAAEFDIRDYVSGNDDSLDTSIGIAPDVPRVCRTCRDFRPSESGERGWCTNDWAFSHRQMVNADTLPCTSTIGCWWLPADATWLPILDGETPFTDTRRTDRLLARLYRRAEDDVPELYVREI